nr:hypothetical protein [Tanacetum cinerariifolium]
MSQYTRTGLAQLSTKGVLREVVTTCESSQVQVSLWGVADEEVVVGEGVMVTSLSLEMFTNNCLGGIMVSLIFLEGLKEEALVEFMVELFEEDDKRNEKYGLCN